MFVNRHISIRARLSYVRRVLATREAINRVLSNGSALRAYIRKYFQPRAKCAARARMINDQCPLQRCSNFVANATKNFLSGILYLQVLITEA